MRKKYWIITLFMAGLGLGHAQADGLPANPQPGKCYVKCISHDEFGPDSEQVQVKPEYSVISVTPPTYKTVTEKVLVKEASKKLVYHPAVYKTVEVPYIKKEKSAKLEVIPATFGKSSKTIEVMPKSSGWEYSTYSECKSSNPEDCKVLCFTETPAKYETIPQTTLASDASTREIPISEEGGTYKKQVVDKPAYVEEIIIPEEYATITRQVVDQPAGTNKKTIPSEFQTVTKQKLTKQGGVASWVEVDCGLVKPNELDILWDYSSANLRGDAKAKIDEVLLTMMNNNPKVSVELASHTDSRGSDDFNMSLSQRRADAIKNYLVSKGIDANRIVSKGYGETRLKNNCSNGVKCSEAQHQVNRRTEYRVIGGNN